MSLKSFSAKLSYTSDQDYSYNSSFSQSKKNPDANVVLVDLIKHLVWMAVIAGKSSEATEAFNRGFEDGTERLAEINGDGE